MRQAPQQRSSAVPARLSELDVGDGGALDVKGVVLPLQSQKGRKNELQITRIVSERYGQLVIREGNLYPFCQAS